MPNEWLKDEHPIYAYSKDKWERDEKRFFGGDIILDELVPFDWEEGQSAKLINAGESPAPTHYEMRKSQAVYINFAELFTRSMVGHLFSKSPKPGAGLSFGTLGDVDPSDGGEPTNAELIYNNTDGVGNHASQWDNFWSDAMQHAMVTGHRWIFTEAPLDAPVTEQDELDGLRPYLVEYSPLSVTNWSFASNGMLDWAIVKLMQRVPYVQAGELKGNDGEDWYLLMVREGYANLGDEYAAGGWWMFDSDLDFITEEITQDDVVVDVPVTGTWESTHGAIPLVLLYYDRLRAQHIVAQMSRGGITEIGQASISYMNLSSAADFDAWDAAQSIWFLLGVDQDAYTLATSIMKGGSKLVPIPVNPQTKGVPQVVDGSTGTVAADTFDKRLERKHEEVSVVAALEASAEPGSSGVSKRAGFADLKAPRLALMASEIEAAQRSVIHFLEMRWGADRAEGEVNWQREFDLLPIVDSVKEIFELMDIAQVSSAKLKTQGILSAAKRKGLLAGADDEDTVTLELETSAAAAETDTLRDGADTAAADAAVAAARAAAPGATPPPPEAVPVQTGPGVEPPLIG